MIYINFSAEINPHTSEALMNCLADQVNRGQKEIYILLSSPGGSTNFGVTLYNYIKSLPTKVIMHNIGMIDSIANVIFLAGEERYAVPHSSFLFHGVGFDIRSPARFDEKELTEKIKIINRDQNLISEIIASRTKLPIEEVRKLFLEAQTKTPEEAKRLGFIHEIKDVKIPEGAQIISFTFPQRPW
ncbi:MAG: ATP-dependent Clp protease proteolytic subunit [Nitrososphaerota archaeon]